MIVFQAYESFVSFTLPLRNDHHVKVSENFLNLRFNLHIRFMHMEQGMYYINADILETIFIPNNMCQYGYI